MVALVQRVTEASVDVGDRTVGDIGRGLLVLLGVHELDTAKDAEWLAYKCAHLRVFADEAGKMNRSLRDVRGEALVVSQFTLYGDVSRGHRPSFVAAAGPEKASELYETFVTLLQGHLDTKVRTGEFGEMMNVRLVNDGPVTLWIERTSANSR